MQSRSVLQLLEERQKETLSLSRYDATCEPVFRSTLAEVQERSKHLIDMVLGLLLIECRWNEKVTERRKEEIPSAMWDMTLGEDDISFGETEPYAIININR